MGRVVLLHGIQDEQKARSTFACRLRGPTAVWHDCEWQVLLGLVVAHMNMSF